MVRDGASAPPHHEERTASIRNDERCIDCRRTAAAIPMNRPNRKSGMSDFDPATHRMVPQQRWFEDFALGERFVIPSRTMTSAVFAAFQTASGDTHPVHYDVEYCRARGMPNLLGPWLPDPDPYRTGSGAVPLYGGRIAGRLPRTVEPILKAGIGRRHDLSRARSDGTDAGPQHRRGLPCAARCSISAASWCWRDCRNFSFADGLSGRDRQRWRARISQMNRRHIRTVR